MQHDPLPALTVLLRGAIGDRLSSNAASFPEMCAEDVVFEAPYAPGGPARLDGREAVAKYLPGVIEDYRIERLELTEKYTTDDPEVVIIEFRSQGSGQKNPPAL